MNQFSSTLRTVEEVYKNEYDNLDSGKNYFIPIYQRDFTWTYFEVNKLIKDLNDVLDQKKDNTFKQYFIGGIVLCRDSILGEERTKKSLEVIDGQQRLTTITIILACLYQQFCYTDRDFDNKTVFIKKLIERLKPLIKYEKANNQTYEVETMYRIDRSDDLIEIYQDLVDSLLSNKIPAMNIYKKQINLTDYTESKNYKESFIKLVFDVNNEFKNYNNDKLLNFTLQLLENTFIVVTKTIDIDTGFLVFEKLNDNGIRLKPNDLLKNFLFSEAKRDEYPIIDKEWESFLSEIDSVNGKMSPKEFLEHYLISQGKQIVDKEHRLFRTLKEEVYIVNKMTSISMLKDLKRTAIEYSSLKNNVVISKYLSLIGFKLGYLIFLSIFKKVVSIKYEESLYDILIQVLRIGFVFIITNYSKLLSNKIPILCKKIYEYNSENINEILFELKRLIDIEILDIKDEFEQTISSSNFYTRRQNLTKFLLNIINYDKDGEIFNETNKNINLIRILPLPEVLENFDLSQFNGITIDNIKNISNQIGNLTVVKYDTEDEFEVFNFEKRKEQILENNKYFIIKPKILEQNIVTWDLNIIEKRNIEILKRIVSIFIEDKFDRSFFKSNYFYLDESKDKNAVMEVLEKDKFKILKGSTCSKKDVEYDWSYSNIRENLINTNILKDEGNYLVFSEDYTFNSTSAAASIVKARQSKGPVDWKDAHGLSFKEKLSEL